MAGARIERVGRQRVEYADTEGQEHFIDLQDCARNWLQWYDEHSQEFLALPGTTQPELDAENARFVGRRGGTHSLWWVEFTNERKTRFIFISWEVLWRELHGPLMLAGWLTFDCE